MLSLDSQRGKNAQQKYSYKVKLILKWYLSIPTGTGIYFFDSVFFCEQKFTFANAV